MPKPVLHSGPLHWAPRKAYIVYLQEFKSLQILELLYEKEKLKNCVHTSQIMLTAAGDGCNGLHKTMACLVAILATLCREIDVSHIISILNLFQAD